MTDDVAAPDFESDAREVAATLVQIEHRLNTLVREGERWVAIGDVLRWLRDGTAAHPPSIIPAEVDTSLVADGSA